MTYNDRTSDTDTGRSVQAIIDVATQAAGPHELEAETIYGWISPDGNIKTLDLTGDAYLDLPKRKRGTVYVDDLDSFIHYWNKHSDPFSEIYVNVDKHYITAVLDAHTSADWEDGARWQDHRLVLKMATSRRWDDWVRADRQTMSQLDWAEFIEDHLDDIREPTAATMLEIAQTFQTSSTVKFGSTQVLANGDRRLHWEETTNATAGEAGKLTVPSSFLVGVAPFDWSEAYEVTARFRYRVSQGKLSVCYLLDDPAAVIRDAVLDIVTLLEERLNDDGSGDASSEDRPRVKVMRGTPVGGSAV